MSEQDEGGRPRFEEESVSDRLEQEDGSETVVAQDNVGYDNMKGGGEWPSPSAPPEAPAPGSDSVAREQIESQRSATDTMPAGTATQAGAQQDASPGGDEGPARSSEAAGGNQDEISPPEHFADVLDRDPVAGGSRTLPDEG